MKALHRHSTSFPRISGVFATLFATIALICSLPSDAAAQELEGTLNVQRLSPAPGPRNFVVTRAARSDGEHALSFGFLAHYGYKPFVVNSVRASTQELTEILVVENLATADMLFSYTPVSAFQLGLRFPLTYVTGQGLSPSGAAGQLEDAKVEAFGISDPELEAKLRLVGDVKSAFALGLAGFVTAPLGEATAKGQFIGNESFTGGGRLIADVIAGPFSTAANVGYRFQKEGRVGASTVGSEVLYSAGLGLQAGPVFQVVADLFGTSGLGGGAGTSTLELGAGARITPLNTPIAITLGGGPGLLQSIGGPKFRVFVGFTYTIEHQDSDGDGIQDHKDQCPADPEDFDGFEDFDGCPDVDNDGDAIVDESDKCPNEAEDLDGFQDADGCPDLDNDKDGIPDNQDRCPNEPETVNGFEDEDGCPDVLDSDKDGIPDHLDKCPNEPEDTDGFQDVDGCPDPDNDGDGIPDDQDECIDEPEDLDGFEDEDGCPEEGAPPPVRGGRRPAAKPPAKPAPGPSRPGSEANPIEL